ncbi:MAG TPA: hypothetical protein VJL29_04875 [Thermoguttaceae bacterium]|nr:hypothetical protein [Thermoguttaceae bacterium]
MRVFVTLCVVAACATFALPALAGDGCNGPECRVKSCSPTCCGSCGHKACRVVCDVKVVKKVVWVVECEEFCVPNPRCPKLCHDARACSQGCTDQCAEGCSSGACDGGCRGRGLVLPKCGPVRCRKKLIKKEIECKSPIYKCVVCGACCNNACRDETPDSTESGAEKPAVQPSPSPTALRFPSLDATR